jgi:hypothetical protein
MKIAFPELTLENTIHILKCTLAMKLSIFEFAPIIQSRSGSPFEESFSAELTIFKLTFIKVSILQIKTTFPVEYISQKLTFIYILLSTWSDPCVFSLSLHLRIDKITYVVSSIGPLEFSIALNLRVF